MSRTLAITLSLALSACFVATRETPIGGQTGPGTASTGGGSTAGGSNAGGPGGGNGAGPQTVDGDATCDQSTCLPATGNFGPLSVAQLTQDEQYLYVVAARPGEYLGSLLRIEKATGARRILFRDQGSPIDPRVPLTIRGGKLYFGRTVAGEIWGLVARMPLDGSGIEDVIETSLGSGSPRELHYDTTGAVIAWARGGQLFQSSIPVSTLPVPSYSGTTSITDVVMTATEVWFIDGEGLKHLDLATSTLNGMLAGQFRRLRVDGSAVYALRENGGIIHANGADPFTAVVSLSGATDFVRAGGKFYASRAAASPTTAALIDSTDTQLEAPRVVQGGFTPESPLAVDAQRMYLGTNVTLAWKSTATPVATCGCAPTVPVFPAGAQACERNLCGSKTVFSRGLLAGAIDGAQLWGVFYDSSFSNRELVRFNLSGGNGITFDADAQLSATIAVDADAVYYSGYSTLHRADKQGNVTITLANDVRSFPYSPPLMRLDATHAYYLATDGIRRVVKTGGTSEAVSTETRATHLQLDDTHVYFMSDSKLMRVPKAGGAAELLAEDFVIDAGYGLSGSHAYFLTARGLERVKKAGGFKTLVLAAGKLTGLPITDLAVQGSDVIVTTAEALDSEQAGLWRVQLGDGARRNVLELGRGQSPLGTLVDAKGYAISTYQDTTWRERGCSCANP